MKTIQKIKCPKCGMEYLPEEIFIPEEFFGYPKNIIRDEHNNIIYFEGKTLNTLEEFDCSNCGCYFTVNAKINFEVKEDKNRNFDEEYYSVNIYKDTIKLDEEEVENKLW